MTPRKTLKDQQNDLFRIRLDLLCDTRHELVRLANSIGWNHLEEQLSEYFCSDTGAPALSTRRMAGLMYLQHAYSLSDEQVVHRWENPYWQYFCGDLFTRITL